MKFYHVSVLPIGLKTYYSELTMQEFFYMGGKAFFVWSAYGITAVALIFSVVLASRRKKKIFKEIEDSLEE